MANPESIFEVIVEDRIIHRNSGNIYCIFRVFRNEIGGFTVETVFNISIGSEEFTHDIFSTKEEALEHLQDISFNTIEPIFDKFYRARSFPVRGVWSTMSEKIGTILR